MCTSQTFIFQAALKSSVHTLLKVDQISPILYDYACDGTPILTYKRSTAELPNGDTVVRTGVDRRKEYYNQKSFFARCGDDDTISMRCYFRDPFPLLHSDAWVLFNCCVDFSHVCGRQAIQVYVYRLIKWTVNRLNRYAR